MIFNWSSHGLVIVLCRVRELLEKTKLAKESLWGEMKVGVVENSIKLMGSVTGIL